MKIAEYRFDDALASAVQQPAFAAVDPGFHRRVPRMQVLGLAAIKERDLSKDADVRLVQALHPERAALAEGFCAFKTDAVSALDDGIGGAEFECLAGGADAGFVRGSN